MEIRRRLVEPFYFPGNQVGCLLIHGFTGSPSEMRFLGDRLAAAGYTVLGIRLAGHGSTVEDMAAARWRDWVKDAASGVAELRRVCDRVIGIGLSMGGLLVLDLASKGELDALVTLNAPMVLQDWRTRLAVLYQPFRRFVRKPGRGSGAADRLEANNPERFAYDQVPVACLASLNRAIRSVSRRLGLVTCPALVMQSIHDATVDPVSAQIIKQCLSSVPVRESRWERSGHILTLGPEREAVALEITKFIGDLGYGPGGPPAARV